MPKQDYSLARAITLLASEQFEKVGSFERDMHQTLVAAHGETSPRGIRIPYSALRDMSAAGVSGSNYLVGSGAPSSLQYIDSLRPRSIALKLGATALPAERGNSLIPKGTSRPTTTWLTDENGVITETQPAFGQIAGTPKIVAVLTDVHRQLLLQSNADAILNRELSKEIAAALDKAVIQGTGVSGQPIGVTVVAGTGAFTGASLSLAALRNAQADVSSADAVLDPATCGYVTTPAVAEILSARQRFSGASLALWEGPLVAGTLEGVQAYSTTNCPTGVCIYGDWSQVVILEWAGGVQLAVDQFSKFSQGLVTIRLLLSVDVLIRHAAGFSIATSVT